MNVLIIVLSIAVVVLGYTTWNLLKKIEFYEQSVEEFYSSLSIVLHTMRSLDEKKMFETDDEVGEVFSQLVEMLNTLRPLLYGIQLNEEEN
jgi:hypothetical protein